MRSRLIATVAGFAVIVGILAIPRTSHAVTLFLGWADEFLGGFIELSVDPNLGTNGGVMFNSSNGPYWAYNAVGWSVVDPYTSPTWQYVGQQSANTTGRANAREKVSVRFRDASPNGYTATVNLTRITAGFIWPEGSACTGTGFSASASQTYDTAGVGAANWKFNNRLLPILDFSYETAGTTATVSVGYISTISVSGMGISSTPQSGCYQIQWLKP